MITVQVPDIVLRQSALVCNYTNFGNRGVDDGTKQQQLHGIIAQNCMALAFGFPFVQRLEQWDGGFDFVIGDQKIDIKNVTRNYTPKPEYEALIVSEQLKYDVQIYMFTSYNQRKNELTVCGWLPKDIFLNRARIYKRGDVVERSDGSTFVCRLHTHQIYLYQLNKVTESFDALKDDIEMYALFS